MPFTLLQVSNTLKSVNTDGGLSAALTLPTGVDLATNLIPRFARFNRYVVVVNTPSRPISVDVNGVVRVLVPAPPAAAVALSAGSTGTLSGTYLSLQTFKILDSLGNIIAESDYSPAMAAAFTVTNDALLATFGVSPDTVSATQLYRTATSGGTYFPWALVDGNTATTYEDSLSDAGLGTVAAPSLGSAPDLTLIAEFGGRLFGVDRVKVDELRYTEAGTMYGWSLLNTLRIPRLGADTTGITALIPRRAALGVARRDTFSQVTGTTRANFNPVIVNGGEQVGVISQESVVVFNDVAYFLFRDGVYQWDSNGIRCVTNGKVRTWFTTDLHFNRSMFWRSFAQLDLTTMRYNLYLASRGSGVIDRWISMDLMTGAWFGPHKTAAFNPTSALWIAGRNQQPYYMVGSAEGFLSQAQEARNDWNTTPIDMSVVTTELKGDDPDQEKYFGEVSVFQEPQTAGSLTLTPSVGPHGAEVVKPAQDVTLTKGRVRAGRVGTGESAILQFDNNVVDQDVVLCGFQIDPVNNIGKR